MRRLLAPSLALLLAPAMAWAAPAPGPRTAESLTAHLREASVVHADFTQTRTLAALTRPLVSRGRLVVDHGRGILWQVRKPFPLTYVITPQGVLEVGPDGRRKVQTAKEAPMAAQMGRVMKALLGGDWSVLESFFALEATGSPSRWEIRLLPRPSAAAFLKGATIQGGRTLERVRLEEPSGDTSEVVFSATRTDLPLDEGERSLLDLK